MFWKRSTKKNNNTYQSDLMVLKIVKNNIELILWKGILEANDIPYIIRDHGVGGYMRIISGSTGLFQSDILVHKTAYEVAKEIIHQIDSS